MAYVIPDAPNNLRVQLQRERQNTRETQFQESSHQDDFLQTEETNSTDDDTIVNNLRHRTSQSQRSYRASNSVSPI